MNLCVSDRKLIKFTTVKFLVTQTIHVLPGIGYSWVLEYMDTPCHPVFSENDCLAKKDNCVGPTSKSHDLNSCDYF